MNIIDEINRKIMMIIFTEIDYDCIEVCHSSAHIYTYIHSCISTHVHIYVDMHIYIRVYICI